MRLKPSAATTRNLGPSLRVALVATALVMIFYAAAVAFLNVFVAHRLDDQVDRQLTSRLAAARVRAPAFATLEPGSPEGGLHYGIGIYGEPIYVWEIPRASRVAAPNSSAPPIAAGSWPQAGDGSVTRNLSGTNYLLLSVPYRGGLLVAGESLTELAHVEQVLFTSELLAAPVLLVAILLASVFIGLRSARPTELARRGQLEFTADASHELRTPISVIEAELSLAQISDGPPDPATFERIARESGRLKRIVDDLLWLARFDSAPPTPASDSVDLDVIAKGCLERFKSIAGARSIELQFVRTGSGPATIVAPEEWIDRLSGVLVDNACKYAGDGGSVRIEVARTGTRVIFCVEDSGPGIGPAELGRMFDRFRRGTNHERGHGLGLAIADSVVRSTAGRWNVKSNGAELGGAHMEVSWRASA